MGGDGLLKATRAFALVTAVAIALAGAGIASQARTVHAAVSGSWPVYHHDDAHTGFDPSITQTVTAATPGWATPGLDEQVYASVLVYNGLVYAATLNNTVYAFNQADGTQAWSTHLRAPATTGWSCGNVSPQGILGTPVIDAGTGRIYAATFGSDDVYRLEGLNLLTGVEELDTLITTTGFDWTIEQQRGALAVRNGYVYVPMGGRNGDCGSYHGYVFGVPTNGSTTLQVYQTPGVGAGFWGAGGVVVDDGSGKVFESSGNGVASGCAANTNGTPVAENDAVVRLSATLTHEDAFIPNDWQSNWCNNDQDLGSASMVLINSHLAFQAGKWGQGFLVDPTALGGMDGQLYPNPRPAPYAGVDVCFGNHSDATFGSFAYAPPYVYLECEGQGLVALNVSLGLPSFNPCDVNCGAPDWHAGGATTFGPPIVAAGAVWVASNGGGLYAFNATTGAQIYHSAAFAINRFVTPSEAGGQVFVPSGNVIRSFNMTLSGATTPAAYIYTQAGSVGLGPANSLGQAPISVAVSGTHLYIGDYLNPVVRDVDLVNNQEGVLAGDDGYGYSGDGGPAKSAEIQGAGAIAQCGAVTYIADTPNYVIRQVDAAGTITTVAGSGVRGNSGDNGPPTSARFGAVFGLSCVTGGSGFMFTDLDSGTLRVVSGGTITTLVKGLSAPTGVIDSPQGDIYISDAATDIVWEVSGTTGKVTRFAGAGSAGYSGDGGPATSGQLDQPYGLAVAPDLSMPATGCGCDVYIADSFNGAIRIVAPNGVITTASQMFSSPVGLSFDGSHTIYVADTNFLRVLKMDISTPGFGLTDVAGNGSPSWSGDGGLASAAQLGNPSAVTFDAGGNEYIADMQNNVIRKVDPSGVISTVAGNAMLPPGYSGDGGPATGARLNAPQGVAVDAAGDIFISDTANHRLRKVDHATGNISTVAGTGTSGFNGDGPATGAELNLPWGLAFDSTGNLFIADNLNHRIRELAGGVITTVAGNIVAGYSGDGGPATSASLLFPTAVAIDATGNVYFTDSGNHRVRAFPVGGTISTVAGTGQAGSGGDGGPATSAQLHVPLGLAFDAAGRLYIGDGANSRVRLVMNGIISTAVGVCGNVAGFSGDGGPASLAHIDGPFGLATDPSGDLFIADANNNRVRATTSTLAGVRAAACQGAGSTPSGRSPISQSPPGTSGPRFSLHLPAGAGSGRFEIPTTVHSEQAVVTSPPKLAPGAVAPAIQVQPARAPAPEQKPSTSAGSSSKPATTVTVSAGTARPDPAGTPPIALLGLFPLVALGLAWAISARSKRD